MFKSKKIDRSKRNKKLGKWNMLNLYLKIINTVLSYLSDMDTRRHVQVFRYQRQHESAKRKMKITAMDSSSNLGLINKTKC